MLARMGGEFLYRKVDRGSICVSENGTEKTKPCKQRSNAIWKAKASSTPTEASEPPFRPEPDLETQHSTLALKAPKVSSLPAKIPFAMALVAAADPFCLKSRSLACEDNGMRFVEFLSAQHISRVNVLVFLEIPPPSNAVEAKTLAASRMPSAHQETLPGSSPEPSFPQQLGSSMALREPCPWLQQAEKLQELGARFWVLGSLGSGGFGDLGWIHGVSFSVSATRAV